MLLRNPFPDINEVINLSKYKEKFDQVITFFVEKLNELFKTIDTTYLKEIFWKLAREEISYNPSNWYHFFSVVLVGIYLKNLLLDEKRMNNDLYLTLKEWYEYFIVRARTFLHKISNVSLIELYGELPVGDKEIYIHLLKEGSSQIKEYDILKILQDDSIDSVTKIRKFHESYLNLYEIFLSRCGHIGKELARHEGNKPYRDNLAKIFNLYRNKRKGRYNNEVLKPTATLKKALILIRHIRNACAHRQFKIIEDNKVEVRDRSWSVIVDVPYLWIYFHLLISLNKELNNVAAFLYSAHWINDLTLRYNRNFLCPDC